MDGRNRQEIHRGAYRKDDGVIALGRIQNQARRLRHDHAANTTR